ncbi:MAG: HlyD family secretion protein [Muribaculaceae bacterium]
MRTKMMICSALALMLGSCGNSDEAYDASGVFEATEVIVSAKTQGEITMLAVDEGDAVSSGDTLGVIDSRQLALQRRQLEDNRLATSEQMLSLPRQIASLRQQIANARREQARFTELLNAKAATQKQVDDITYEINTLEAQLQALTDQVESKNRSLSSQGAGIDSQIGQVDVQLSDATVTSPLTGVVLTRYCEPGEYAMPGKALFKIGDIVNMKLRAYVDAEQVNRLRIGQKAKVYADEGTEGRRAYDGRVTWISPKAEFTPKTVQTRDERANLVYAVKIAVNNGDGLIKAGMYGDVAFE